MKQRFTVRGKHYELDKEDIIRSANNLANKTEIRKYYIEFNGEKISIKQVIQKALDTPPVDFTSMDAYHILKKLGFEIKLKK